MDDDGMDEFRRTVQEAREESRTRRERRALTFAAVATGILLGIFLVVAIASTR